MAATLMTSPNSAWQPAREKEEKTADNHEVKTRQKKANFVSRRATEGGFKVSSAKERRMVHRVIGCGAFVIV